MSSSEILITIIHYLPWLVGVVGLILAVISLLNAISIRRKAYKDMNIKFQEMEKRIEKKLNS